MSSRDDQLQCLEEVPLDIVISQSVKPVPVARIAEDLGLDIGDDVEAYGRFKAKLNLSILQKIEKQPKGFYVCVTSTTPTQLGIGKTTVTVGLCQALGKQLCHNTIACIRQPSSGPTFGIKGGAAGGGYSQVIPMEDLNLHLTGDIHAVSLAHNLLAAALDSRVFHEAQQDDQKLFNTLVPFRDDCDTRVFNAPQRRRLQRLGMDPTINPDKLSEGDIRRFVRLDIDPSTIVWRRVVDMNDRSLRRMELFGDKVGPGNGREAVFDITAASELMVILALSTDMRDLQLRLRRVVVAYSKLGEPVTADDLCCAGGMLAILKEALKPTLMQTLEGTAVLIHTGPFANIAHGNSSILADRMALKLVGENGYVVTEAGFGADVGFEKFCNIKCRLSGLQPDCVVIVTSIRSLKRHGGAPAATAGKPIPSVYREANREIVERGCCNLERHIRNCQKFGATVVVAINKHRADDESEISAVVERAKAAGAFDSVVVNCWAKGSMGGINLAQAVVEGCNYSRTASRNSQFANYFQPLYPLHLPLKEKIEIIARTMFGAKSVEYSEQANMQIQKFESHGYGSLPICFAKTQYSISHDPHLIGAPEGFVIPIAEVRLAAGAGFVLPLCGQINTMPGLPTRPAFFDVDVDCETGEVRGLF